MEQKGGDSLGHPWQRPLQTRLKLGASLEQTKLFRRLIIGQARNERMSVKN